MTDSIVEHRELLETLDQELIPAATTPEVKAMFRKHRAAVARHLSEACAIGETVEAHTGGCPEKGERGTR